MRRLSVRAQRAHTFCDIAPKIRWLVHFCHNCRYDWCRMCTVCQVLLHLYSADRSFLDHDRSTFPHPKSRLRCTAFSDSSIRDSGCKTLNEKTRPSPSCGPSQYYSAPHQTASRSNGRRKENSLLCRRSRRWQEKTPGPDLKNASAVKVIASGPSAKGQRRAALQYLSSRNPVHFSPRPQELL